MPVWIEGGTMGIMVIITSMPGELIGQICGRLWGRDLAAMRLTCRALMWRLDGLGACSSVVRRDDHQGLQYVCYARYWDQLGIKQLESIAHSNATYRVVTRSVQWCTVIGILGADYERYIYSVRGLAKHMIVTTTNGSNAKWGLNVDQWIDVYVLIWEWLSFVGARKCKLHITWCLPSAIDKRRDKQWMYSTEVVEMMTE